MPSGFSTTLSSKCCGHLLHLLVPAVDDLLPAPFNLLLIRFSTFTKTEAAAFLGILPSSIDLRLSPAVINWIRNDPHGIAIDADSIDLGTCVTGQQAIVSPHDHVS